MQRIILLFSMFVVIQVMDFLDMRYCRKDLDFAPRQKWPEALPPMSWKQWLIAGFDSLETKALQLSEPHLHRAFQSCYPRLSLPELARLFSVFSSSDSRYDLNSCVNHELGSDKLSMDWVGFFAAYGLRDCENLRLTLGRLVETPIEFQDWCSKRQLSPKDLSILRSLSSVTSLTSFFLSLSHRNPSRSMGSEILTLFCELYLMGNSIESITQEELSVEAWHNSLRKARYPRASRRDESVSLRLKSLPWPTGCQVKWLRSGDRSGLDVKFQVYSPEGFKKYINGLGCAYEIIEKEWGQLW